jgi:hypothetical protein
MRADSSRFKIEGRIPAKNAGIAAFTLDVHEIIGTLAASSEEQNSSLYMSEAAMTRRACARRERRHSSP